jgi:hypothetical protein
MPTEGNHFSKDTLQIFSFKRSGRLNRRDLLGKMWFDYLFAKSNFTGAPSSTSVLTAAESPFKFPSDSHLAPQFFSLRYSRIENFLCIMLFLIRTLPTGQTIAC